MALPGQSDEERLAIEQQVFSNEDLNLDSVAHTRVRRSGVYTQVYHFCLGKAFQEGRRTGATGGSMPVGSGRFRDYAQDPRGILGMTFASSLALSEEGRVAKAHGGT
jgi:hypothetical protein